VSYFRAVRLYSAVESAVLVALLVVWIGGFSDSAKLVLGWVHGIAWILLCVLVAIGCRRRVFPYPLLAVTLSPAGPLASSLGIEILRRHARVTPAASG
jgi:hypothetical protein